MIYLEAAACLIAAGYVLVGLMWLASKAQWHWRVWRARSPGGTVLHLAKPRQCD